MSPQLLAQTVQTQQGVLRVKIDGSGYDTNVYADVCPGNNEVGIIISVKGERVSVLVRRDILTKGIAEILFYLRR